MSFSNISRVALKTLDITVPEKPNLPIHMIMVHEKSRSMKQSHASV
jgi:hypothetical protein